MHYQISRNGQTYGPYTLEDLQRYVASGNVLPSDMAKSESMTDWVPVSQLLAGAATGAAAEPSAAGSGFGGGSNAGTGAGYTAPIGEGYPQQGYPAPMYNQAPGAGLAASPYDDAPNLNWGVVLILALLTCSLFMFIWNLVVAAWLRRVQPNATSLFYYAGAGVLALLQFFVTFHVSLHHALSPGLHMYTDHPLRSLLGLVVWIVRLVARFSQRASLEEHFNGPEPVGLRLNPVLTFFFGGLYFQYHLNRINTMKQAARYGMVRQF